MSENPVLPWLGRALTEMELRCVKRAEMVGEQLMMLKRPIPEIGIEVVLAVIRELREPTAEMNLAGEMQCPMGSTAEPIWGAMIAAASPDPVGQETAQ